MKNFLLFLFIQTILMGQVFSASRVDAVISLDREQTIDKISLKLFDLKGQKTDLDNLEKHLRFNHKGHSIYLKFETIAGAVIGVGIVIGSYKAHFPPGFRAMVGAYVTVTGISRGLIKLNDKEVKVLLEEIAALNKKMTAAQASLQIQLKSQCDEITDHPLCEKEFSF